MSLTTNPERPTDVTSLDSSSSDWGDVEDMSTVSNADVINGQTCGAVGNPRPDMNDKRFLSSRPNSILTWRELKHHIKSSPSSVLRHAALYPTVLCPERPETPRKQCRHCGKSFMLGISLEIHMFRFIRQLRDS
jgi:hypothetical protein